MADAVAKVRLSYSLHIYIYKLLGHKNWPGLSAFCEAKQSCPLSPAAALTALPSPHTPPGPPRQLFQAQVSPAEHHGRRGGACRGGLREKARQRKKGKGRAGGQGAARGEAKAQLRGAGAHRLCGHHVPAPAAVWEQCVWARRKQVPGQNVKGRAQSGGGGWALAYSVVLLWLPLLSTRTAAPPQPRQGVIRATGGKESIRALTHNFFVHRAPAARKRFAAAGFPRPD